MNGRRSGRLAVGVLPPLLAERFTVVRELGGGAIATVLLAFDRSLGRQVAVKVFEPTDEGSELPGRFDREILLTSRLCHPLIVPVLAHGTAGDQRFYVMPYVPDETLRSMLQRQPLLGVPHVVRVALDLCEALSYAHAAGIVHRDLRPENIFCGPARAQLNDFGIATAAGSATGLRLTQSGVVHGTATYMSPEQAMARHDLDGRSDLYALGCILWELLAGQPPFRHSNMMQLVALHVNAPVPDLAALAGDTPAALISVVHDLLAKSREERPATAAQVHERLLPLRADVADALSLPVATPTPRSVEVLTPSMQAYRHGQRVLTRGLAGGDGASESLRVAHAYFTHALTTDPGNTAAQLGLAEAIQALGTLGPPGTDTAERAQRESAAIRHSAVLHPGTTAEAHVVLAETLLYWDDDVAAAGRMVAKALALEPDHPGALRLHGVWLKVTGHAEEAAQHLRAAVRMHPHDPELHVALADVLVALGRNLEALRTLRAALRRDPRHATALDRMARCAHRAGLPAQAADARRGWLQQSDQVARVAALHADLEARGWTEAREADLARAVVAIMRRAATEDAFLPRGAHRQLSDDLLVALADLGLWTEAMDCVAEGARRRPARLRLVLTDLPFDRRGLASDARYAPLLCEAGLEELL